jgi:phospholipase C
LLLSSLAGCQSLAPADPPTRTPIKHLVVIFQENVSFDHYFGTYPNAANPQGEPAFVAAPGTLAANTLATPLDPERAFAPRTGIDLLRHNPNFTNKANDHQDAHQRAVALNPFRLDRAQAATADQDHEYTAEQQAFDGGAMDLFPLHAGAGDVAAPQDTQPPLDTTGLVMGYYDGNTVTALWNYAQHFAMSDNSFGTTFGPSTPGALNLVSGQTGGVVASNAQSLGAAGHNKLDEELASDGQGGATVTGDPQPLGDVCSTRDQVRVGGSNIGDLLNARGLTWGFFQGGFDLGVTNADGSTGCRRTTTSAITRVPKADYIPHHQPFQYYTSTANPQHLRPGAARKVGASDAANHQYDLHDFFDALDLGVMPAVSFLKAPGYQDGHAGYSDPLDEQRFLVETLNRLQRAPQWPSTAVLIAYDDSDGWYDHQASPIVNPSTIAENLSAVTVDGVALEGANDALNGSGRCVSSAAMQGRKPREVPLDGPVAPAVQGRCGYGPRLPLLLISPYAKTNFVDHRLTDQSSILRFIEDNWLDGARIRGSFDALAGDLDSLFDFSAPPRPPLLLDPATGLAQP